MGGSLLVLHGDEADALVRTHPLIARLGSHAYDLLVTINTVSNEIRRRLGFRPWSFSGALKRGVKRAVTYIGNFELALTTMVRDRGLDGVICGHIHVPAIDRREDMVYANCGDWIEHASAIAEADDGTLVLLEFLPEVRETAEPGRAVPKYVLEDGLALDACLTGTVPGAIVLHANSQRIAPDPIGCFPSRLFPAHGAGRRRRWPCPADRARVNSPGARSGSSPRRTRSGSIPTRTRSARRAPRSRRCRSWARKRGATPSRLDKALRLRIAELEGLRPEYVETFNGSSDPLHRAVLAFTGPDRAYVYGEPGFEAGWQAAKISGAPAIAVPLTPTIAHDARAMCAATATPGLLYICNPNNPTGTITPRDEIVWALANKPAGSILLVDEAYIHFSDETSVVDLVDSHGDLLVLRTFSKLYGMAGLRMGLAIAQPPVLDRLRSFGGTISSITGVTAARISVDDPSLMPDPAGVHEAGARRDVRLPHEVRIRLPSVAEQLLHAGCEAPGRRARHCDGAAQCAHRPDVAGLAQLLPGSRSEPRTKCSSSAPPSGR